MSIEVGLKGRAETVVTQENTAMSIGSGLVPVFATPYMIALMENAAYTSLLPHLSEEEGSVGTHLNVAHSAATPVGMKVWAESVVTAVEGKKITFEVHAYDERGEIGSGTHERFIIKPEKFLAKAQSKLEG
ncbi:thioesterase family protein [Pseudoflavonifractor capillosus]|uniref:thioesterase family protein n=1 Tax=Pseudoflavonifractor capillosus TaxID=106588 RepID=UPI00195613E7|nr:thioesterase family protein [Pseudoflavonifractor capillosus]MBM6896495.1 thioesterase family protein [Pseudoflavonifractor capillosus]